MYSCNDFIVIVQLYFTLYSRLRRDRHRLHAATAHGSPVSDNMPYQQPASGSPLWFPYRLPRGLYEWIYPDSPPPAYSECQSLDYAHDGHQMAYTEQGNHQPQDYEAPPPYTREQQESQSLIQQNFMANQNMVINPIAMHLQQSPPDYNDINGNDVNANHQVSLLPASDPATLEDPGLPEPKEEAAEVGENEQNEENKTVESDCQSNSTGVTSVEPADQDNVAESLHRDT
jgi:hypothetical protein